MSAYEAKDFSLPRDKKQLAAPIAVGTKLHQISSTRGLSAGNFYGGVIEFPFDFGSHQYLDMTKSFLRVRMTLQQASAAPAASLALAFDDTDGKADTKSYLSLAMNVCATLFSDVEFRMGGVSISKMSSDIAQCSSLKERLTRTKDWMDTVGISARLMDAKSSERNAHTSAATTKFCTGLTGAQQIEVCWTPPLGVFDHILPCGGKMSLVLTPYSLASVVPRAVEHRIDADAAVIYNTDLTQAEGNYNFTVDDCYFYAYVIDTAKQISDGEHWLDLEELRMQSEAQTTTTYTHHTFTVSKATKRICVAFQDNRAGTDDAYSPTVLKIGGSWDYSDGNETVHNLEAKVNRLCVQYAGQTLTPRDLDTEHEIGTKQFLTYAYQTICNEQGEPSETLGEWINRGLYMSFEVAKPKDNLSTRCVISTGFSQTPTNGRVLCFDWSAAKAKLVYQSGRLRAVEVSEG